MTDLAGVLLRGLAIGVAIAAPVGPIGVLCIRRTLVDGRLAGFLSGLGAATADGVYAAIAGFGITVVSSALVAQQQWFRVLGGAFLCYLGARTIGTQPAARAATPRPAGAYLSTFALTLANPATVLSFVAVFAGLGLADVAGRHDRAAVLVAGVFLGSTVWWLALALGVGRLGQRLGPRAFLWINRVAGTVLVVFGLAALASAIPRS